MDLIRTLIERRSIWRVYFSTNTLIIIYILWWAVQGESSIFFGREIKVITGEFTMSKMWTGRGSGDDWNWTQARWDSNIVTEATLKKKAVYKKNLSQRANRVGKMSREFHVTLVVYHDREREAKEVVVTAMVVEGWMLWWWWWLPYYYITAPPPQRQDHMHFTMFPEKLI